MVWVDTVRINYNTNTDSLTITNINQMDFIHPDYQLFMWGRKNFVRIKDNILTGLGLNPYTKDLYNKIFKLYSSRKKLRKIKITGLYINIDNGRKCTADFLMKNIKVSDIKIVFLNKREHI